jgi:sec-independent protein translocase protein TatA
MKRAFGGRYPACRPFVSYGGRSYGELLTPTHLLVITLIAVVLFGGKNLPGLGKGVGEGLRGFRDGSEALPENRTNS